jgi:hypothetical protein
MALRKKAEVLPEIGHGQKKTSFLPSHDVLRRFFLVRMRKYPSNQLSGKSIFKWLLMAAQARERAVLQIEKSDCARDAY